MLEDRVQGAGMPQLMVDRTSAESGGIGRSQDLQCAVRLPRHLCRLPGICGVAEIIVG